MKKVVVAALMTTGLMAADNGFYLGVDLGNTGVDIEAKAPSIGYSTTLTDDGGSQTLKIGYFFDKHSRINGFYQNINVDDGEGKSYGIGYDYLIGENALKPFIGVLVGYTGLTNDSLSADISGNIFGVQGGLNYALNEAFSLEAGYRYLKSNAKDTISISGIDAEFKMDPLKNWFIGANYKF